jgi:hypothetical protein
MFEAMATLILVIVGAVLIIFILGYGIYITFYPLSKTVKGGIDAMKEHAEEKERGTKKKYAPPTTDHVPRARRGKYKGVQKRKKKFVK